MQTMSENGKMQQKKIIFFNFQVVACGGQLYPDPHSCLIIINFVTQSNIKR